MAQSQHSLIRKIGIYKHIRLSHRRAERQCLFTQSSDRPILCVVGGTGFSYAHALIEALAAEKTKRAIQLYWGVREQDAFYNDKPVKEWLKNLPQLQYEPIVEFPFGTWNGRTGRLIDAVEHDHINLAHYDIYIAGRFEMAGAARQAFIDRGANPKHIFGDAFSMV